jgi:predicted ATPase/DNA-binding NarL/FixJ family response regulator
MVGQRAPDDPGRLIGREHELAVVERRLTTVRLLTIAGLGGVGKTSLAREAAARSEAAGRRTIFVDLAPVSDRGGVASAIATIAGAAEEDELELVDAIAEVLAGPPSLLVLDNFEHLLDASAEIDRLLGLVPTLRVMTTSRVPLGLPDESVLELGSLGLPTSRRDVETSPAGALFLERARERSRLPDLQLEDADAVIEICRRLDGLPLALELAAAWSGILTPRAIARRLDDNRLDLASDDPRQASLDAVIDATLSFVDPGDRAAFALLGVFSGSFDDRAAGAVSCDPQVLTRLRNLARVALIRVTADAWGEPRFELLETIRAFALRRLVESGQLTELHRRHAAHYADRALAAADRVRTTSFSDRRAGAALADPNIPAAAERMVELGETELAVRLAAALASHAMQTGILRSALQRLEMSMALAGGSAGVRSDGLNARVSLRGALGQRAGLRPLAAEAVALARAADDPIRIVRTLITLGNMTDGDRSAPYAEAAELAERVGYAWGAATALGSLADALWSSGRSEEAIAAVLRAHAASERQGDQAGIANWIIQLGEYELNLGRIAEGLAHLEQAAPMLRASPGLPFFVTTSLTLLATAQALAGRLDAAYRTLVAAADRVELAESGQDIEDWLESAAIVLESQHPVAAARALGAMDRIRDHSGLGRISEPLQQAAASRIEHAIGRPRSDRSRASGRDTEPQALFAELARLVRREAGPDSDRLRAPFGLLTRREREILVLLAEGRTDREIGDELGIAAKTASVHVANLKGKLGVDTRVEAVIFARDRLGGSEP